tara:strand:+ start:140 stop:331 length:192 start_codon:yes stop_codon:yes gene_type:complete
MIFQYILLALVIIYSTIGWISYFYDTFFNKIIKSGEGKVFQANSWKFERMTKKLKDESKHKQQ